MDFSLKSEDASDLKLSHHGFTSVNQGRIGLVFTLDQNLFRSDVVYEVIYNSSPVNGAFSLVLPAKLVLKP